MFCHVRCLIVVFVCILSSIVVTLLEKGKLIALLSLDVDSVMICLLLFGVSGRLCCWLFLAIFYIIIGFAMCFIAVTCLGLNRNVTLHASP